MPIRNTSFSDGIQFPGTSPIAEGAWVNKNTGKVINVRDSYFEGDQYIVITSEGERLDYNTFQHYLKCSDNTEAAQVSKQIKDAKSQVSNAKQQHSTTSDVIAPDIQALVSESSTDSSTVNFDDLIDPEDLAAISGTPRTNIPQSKQTQTFDPDKETVAKILSRLESPQFSTTIKFTEDPAQQIRVLTDVLKIDTKYVVDYYLNNINFGVLRESLKSDIEKFVCAAITDPKAKTAKSQEQAQDATKRVPGTTKQTKPNGRRTTKTDPDNVS